MTQKEALDILKIGHNAYITGKAGSGKTYVLNQYIQYLREHDITPGITASTGIAATHMNGVTIHSWCGIGIRQSISDLELDALEQKQYLWTRFKKAKILILDEISMLGAEHLDLINRVCKAFKRSDRPFGGMQVVLCGDFFQLPPVTRGEDLARLAYNSKTWKELDLRVCYLGEQHRQFDTKFTSVLNKIRDNEIDEELLTILRDCKATPKNGDIRPTRLFTHNVDVDALNERELEGIGGATKAFTMVSHGNPRLVEILRKSCLAPEVLRLKQGAQVMFVKNNFEAGYVNGTLGIVLRFEADGSPVIETIHGKVINATPESWTVEEDGKVKAEISQIPLRLAWAITVHKSQGMSLDAAEIDLSRSFVPGQGYVALSRVRSLAGLTLLGFNDVALRIDPNVLEFDKELLRLSQKSEAELSKIADERRKELFDEFILKNDGTLAAKKVTSHLKEKKPVRISTFEETKLLLEKGKTLEEIAQIREMTLGTIIGHVEKLVENEEVDPLIDLEHVKPDPKTLKTMLDAFKKIGDTKLTPVFEHLKGKYTFDNLKLARIFLNVE